MSKRKVSVEQRLNKPITNTISQFISQPNNGHNHKNNSNNIPQHNNNSSSNINTQNNTNINNNESTNNVIDDNKEIETNIVTKNETVITQTKRIQIGNDVFKSVYTSGDEVKRAAYHLRQDTIDKIERCAKLSGLKKAEFVDLILNNILTDILNKVDK